MPELNTYGCNGVKIPQPGGCERFVHAMNQEEGTPGKLPSRLSDLPAHDTVPQDYMTLPVEVKRRPVSRGALLYSCRDSQNNAQGAKRGAETRPKRR
jgi:hypothetical protein